MIERYAKYLEDMRARHAATLKTLAKCKGPLAKRALVALRTRYAAQEKETEGILAEIEAREAGSPS